MALSVLRKAMKIDANNFEVLTLIARVYLLGKGKVYFYQN